MGGFGVLGLWLTLAVTIVVAIATALGFLWLAKRTLGKDVDPAHNPSLSPFLTVVGLVFGALLGFTVVVAWEQFSSADANVAHEASTLTTMYRQTVAMPEPQRTQLRQQLRKYAEAVAGPEWSAQETGDRADHTARSAITNIYRLFGSRPAGVSSPVDGEFLGQLTVLATDRNQRALDQKPRIPGLLWAGLIVGGALAIAIAGFIQFRSQRGHVILTSGVALLLGLLLFIVYWLDHPFGTQIGVTPAPFHQAIEVFDIIDQGT
ncbi:DUF4239 domain-containing protein [Mycobacterium sp. OTB74]|jgi:hypothetical protein|uniref:bestrophin-like domain n=1 Tax=Mycobacterium sp. OTB74 TaxID=1853452 RepID=UPI002477192D|nr:DUF4239 domain-containing protein [Mycobacterium sp. OTB74]MDH6242670.1 hypothetical protein [Mycobacterium sp. OTB74]